MQLLRERPKFTYARGTEYGSQDRMLCVFRLEFLTHSDPGYCNEDMAREELYLSTSERPSAALLSCSAELESVT